VTHHAAIIEPEKIGELLRAIDNYRGHRVTEAALKLAPLLFVRPGELRLAEWADIRLEGADPEYRIPAHRMKMREQHVVPLSRQAVEVLRGILTERRKMMQEWADYLDRLRERVPVTPG
jgi:integrase